ncbi:unnamed protein product [Microthlaspi erraticum]|uniref:F-box domain-containing protein n=1 Tax=Microthlaspi erraticum TaxID=1685480 RepID=A0A6D2KUC6_9BRAS|nr:unnamed protein product [Microthlaspi erraticum]
METEVNNDLVMAPAEELPSALVEEILLRSPKKSLAQFRAVSKPWNAIWEDKIFLNKYFARARPEFILRTNSQICSVAISLDDDHVEVRDITSHIPFRIGMHSILVHCDGFLLSGMWKKGFAVWNPWLSKKRFVENHEFRFCGVGYDNTRPETGYKIFGVYFCADDATSKLYPKVAIYECKTDAWRFIRFNAPSEEQDWRVPQLDSIVSLNGNLYWISYHSPEYSIRSFDFSEETFKTFCLLPASSEEDFGYTQVLGVFEGDRFSVLRQSYLTGKIEILVTKQNIERKAVVWINLMTVSIPNLPRLQQKCLACQPSYFVDNKKKLFVCTCDEAGNACIYIVERDVFKKIPIESVVDLWPSHLTYIPSFVPIPLNQQGSQV